MNAVSGTGAPTASDQPTGAGRLGPHRLDDAAPRHLSGPAQGRRPCEALVQTLPDVYGDNRRGGATRGRGALPGS